jgi:hypothetical protein
MNVTGIYHLFWITLVIANFVLQLLYFFNDRNRLLFLAKKITTPLLLFGGLAVVIVSSGGFPIIPGIVLLAMGLGEMGIEGSTVVESKTDLNRSTAGRGTPWTRSRIRICNYDGPVYYHSLPTSGGNSDTAVVVFGRIGDSGRRCVSDSLVLIRKGAGWNKDRPSGHWTLMVFLIIILLLYYLFIALLIGMAAPFRG